MRQLDFDYGTTVPIIIFIYHDPLLQSIHVSLYATVFLSGIILENNLYNGKDWTSIQIIHVMICLAGIMSSRTSAEQSYGTQRSQGSAAQPEHKGLLSICRTWHSTVQAALQHTMCTLYLPFSCTFFIRTARSLSSRPMVQMLASLAARAEGHWWHWGVPTARQWPAVPSGPCHCCVGSGCKAPRAILWLFYLSRGQDFT